jgi:hypothetical protein
MELIGYSENNVEMIGIQNAGFLSGKPSFNLSKGAQRAHAVFTGIIPVTLVMTIGTGLGMTSQNGGAADHDAVGGFSNMFRQSMHLIIVRIS